MNPFLPPTPSFARTPPPAAPSGQTTNPNHRRPAGARPPAAGPAAPAAPEPFRLPGYEILGEVGRGGEGVVYKARQVALNRLVALKVLLAGRHAGPEALARFRHEAEAVASLNHPHIVRIYDVGVHEGRPFISLELADGGSLARHLEGQPMPPRDGARLVEGLARAMHAAHAQGVVHRDLKPGNVLLFHGPQGGAADTPAAWTAKVGDFGVAKRLGGAAGRTHTGELLGTPSYMAPEQAEGRPGAVGPPADVYALGAILYECLTGTPPFLGTDPVDTLVQVRHAEPAAPSRRCPGVPRDLDTICLKCLRKEPSGRYGSAGDLADELVRFLGGEPIRARPVGLVGQARRWCCRKPGQAALTAALLLALAAGFAAVTALWLLAEARSGEADAQRRETADALRRESLAHADGRRQLARLYLNTGTRLMDEGDLLGSLVWLTEAQRLDAEAGAGDDGRRRDEAHRRRLSAVLAPCPRLLQLWAFDGAVADVGFSPDGGRVLLAAGDAAGVYDVRTGEPVCPPARHIRPVRAAALAPDGRHFLTVTTSQRLAVWDAATGEERTPPGTNEGAGATEQDPKRREVYGGEFGRDGRRVVMPTSDGACVADLAAGKAGPLVPRPSTIACAVFAPDGRRVAAAQGAETWLLDAATGARVGEVMTHPGDVVGQVFHPDGRHLLVWARDHTARVWDTESCRPAAPPLTHDGDMRHAAFSPDGGRVVTCADDGTARVWDTGTGKPLAPPLRHAAQVSRATFSPDGRRVVTVGEDGTARVWDAATGRPVAPPLRHGQGVCRAAFSPDGGRLLTAGRDGVARLWDLTGPGPVSAVFRHAKAVSFAGFSPDGARLVTTSDDNTARVWEPGGAALTPPLRHAGPVHHAAFHPDGRRLTTASTWHTDGRDVGLVRTWDLATGRPEPDAIGVGAGVVRHISYGPDGGRMLLRGPYTANVWDAGLGRDLVSLGYFLGSAPALSPDGTRLLRITGKDGVAARLSDLAAARDLEPPLHSAVNHVAFAPDGRRLVTASGDGTACVWDLRPAGTPSPAATLRHAGPVRFATFSPDGSRVLTVGDDQAARVWDATTGEPISAPLRHAGGLAWAAFHPDGRRLLTVTEPPAASSEGGQVRLWDSFTGQPLAPPLRHTARVNHAEFSPDGSRLLTACADGRARLWDVSPADARPADDLLLLAQLLSGQALDGQGDAAPLSPAALRATWDELRARYPDGFSGDEGRRREWHRREAEDAAAAGQKAAEAFHRARLAGVGDGKAP